MSYNMNACHVNAVNRSRKRSGQWNLLFGRNISFNAFGSHAGKQKNPQSDFSYTSFRSHLILGQRLPAKLVWLEVSASHNELCAVIHFSRFHYFAAPSCPYDYAPLPQLGVESIWIDVSILCHMQLWME